MKHLAVSACEVGLPQNMMQKRSDTGHIYCLCTVHFIII
jgi:hypothetical protein